MEGEARYWIVASVATETDDVMVRDGYSLVRMARAAEEREGSWDHPA